MVLFKRLRVFAVSKSTLSLLSDALYRTELSFFIAKLWPDEMYGCCENI